MAKQIEQEAIPTSADVKSGKSRKGFKKPRGKGYKPAKTNDVSWYMYNPELVKSAAQLSFGEVTGLHANLTQVGAFFINYQSNVVLPSVVAIKLQHTFDTGCFYDPNNGLTYGTALGPVNVAARNIYSYVRHANSGHTNYDSPDLMVYLLAMSEVYSLIFFLIRTYAMLNTFDPRNRAYPEALFVAQHMTYYNFLNEIANLRFYILSLIKRVSALNVPAQFPLFKRAAWRYANLYKDCEDGKAATIITVPTGFYRFDTSRGNGSELAFEALPNLIANFGQLKQYAETIVSDILADEDFGIMSGDILKAYGDGGLFHIAEFDENLTCFPTYDNDVLMQFENAQIVNLKPTGSLYLGQNPTTGILDFPMWIEDGSVHDQAVSGLLCSGKIFNIHVETPTPENIIEWSALTVTAEYDAANVICGITHCGTEMIVDISINGAPFINSSSGLDTTTNSTTIFRSVPMYMLQQGYSTSDASLYDFDLCQQRIEDLLLRECLRTIDHMPFTYSIATVRDNSGTVNGYYVGTIGGELDNWTVITAVEVKKFHDCRWMSLLAVPAMK